MEDKSYTNTYDHYDEMINAHKMTRNLFGVIPFRFKTEKYLMAVLMAVIVYVIQLIFSLSLLGLAILFLLFIIFSLEYNRIYDMRDEIVGTCIKGQVLTELEIESGCKQLPDAPNYVDHIDVTIIFEDAIFSYKYKHRKELRMRLAKLIHRLRYHYRNRHRRRK